MAESHDRKNPKENAVEDPLRPMKRITMGLMSNVGLVLFNTLLLYALVSRSGEIRDPASTPERATLEAIHKELVALSQDIIVVNEKSAWLAKSIIPAEKLKEVFTKDMTSSIRLVTKKIDQLKEKIQDLPKK